MKVKELIAIFTSIVEMFIKVTPQHINNKKDDGFTMLQLAALNGNIEVVNALASSVSCMHFVYRKWC